MENLLKKYKGIHPGVLIKRELKKKEISQRSFALSIGEHPQSFNAILLEKRNLPVALALKIEKKLSYKEGELALLQTFYQIQRVKEQKMSRPSPNRDRLRKSLFWDTEFDKIDWIKQAKAVVERVFERGNTGEKEEVINFYGKDRVIDILNEKLKTDQFDEALL